MVTNYLNVALESAWNASIAPFGNEATFYAMKAFGNFDMRLAALMAVMGAVAGQLSNWVIGRLMLWMKMHGKAKIIREETYEKARRFFHKYLMFILFFSWFPLLKFAVLAAGFLNVRFRTALILVAAGHLLHYGWFLYQ